VSQPDGFLTPPSMWQNRPQHVPRYARPRGRAGTCPRNIGPSWSGRLSRGKRAQASSCDRFPGCPRSSPVSRFPRPLLMLAMGKHVVETEEFDLDGVWLSPSRVAIVLFSRCFEERLQMAASCVLPAASQVFRRTFTATAAGATSGGPACPHSSPRETKTLPDLRPPGAGAAEPASGP
jgi:hypothetical protein